MPLSTDVNLPKSHKPTFPDRCVVCGRQSPGSTVRLCTGAIGWWTWLLWTYGKPFVVQAPACGFCGWRLGSARLVSVLITIALAVFALCVVWPLVADNVPRVGRKWAMMGLALLCVAPQISYQIFFPHPFDVTAYRDSVDYEFRDEELAHEFALSNLDAEWVKIS